MSAVSASSNPGIPPENNNCLDHCLTGVVFVALAAKSTWVLTKYCGYELGHAGAAGWEETKKFFHHLAIVAGSLAFCVSSLVIPFLKESRSLFVAMGCSIPPTFHATKISLVEGFKLVAQLRKPLSETAAACCAGLSESEKAAIHFWGALHSVGTLIGSATKPFLKETASALAAGAEETKKFGYASLDALTQTKDVLDALLGGFLKETASLFGAGKDQTEKTFHFLKTAIRLQIQMSRETTGLFFKELGAACASGRDEMIKTFFALPPAFQSLFFLPKELLLSFFAELKEFAEEGQEEIEKAFCGVGIALEQGTMGFRELIKAFCQEMISLFSSGKEESVKAGYAVIMAADNSTEGFRDLLKAFLVESRSALVSGFDQTCKTTSVAGSFYRGIELPLELCVALVKELCAAFSAGHAEMQNSLRAFWIAAIEGSAPLRILIRGFASETASAIKEGATETRKAAFATRIALKTPLEISKSVIVGFLKESASACHAAYCEAVKFNHHMSDGVTEAFQVHFLYPAERRLYPKVKAVKRSFANAAARIQKIIDRMTR